MLTEVQLLELVLAWERIWTSREPGDSKPSGLLAIWPWCPLFAINRGGLKYLLLDFGTKPSCALLFIYPVLFRYQVRVNNLHMIPVHEVSHDVDLRL